MKILMYCVVVFVALAVLGGFSLSVYKVENLSEYPDLDFSTTVNSLSDAAASSVSWAFPILSSVADGVYLFFDQFDEDYPTWWTDDEVYFYEKLMEIEDELSWWDRMTIRLALMSKLPASTFEKLYSKYYDRGGIGGDF